ncbi:MAG: Gfo/Idh/MocA family oxidoreductase [Pirellulales bacterium]|nr:Gfo/Idh/MocA family oxidoreductase [Pirellulales bacterium]
MSNPTWNRREALQQLVGALAVSVTPGSLRAEDGKQAARPRIKVGQIGTGHAHAARTLLTHRESSEFEVVGVVEPDKAMRRQAEAHPAYRGLPWMSQEQLLNLPGLQAVLVETQVRNLLDAAEACVAAGKHVHIDKPAGESLPHFKRILASAKRQHLWVQMGYVYRYNPGVVLLRSLVAKGWLGDIFEIHGLISEKNTPETRRRLAAYSGGMLFELGGHVIDVIIGLMGTPERVTPFVQHASKLDDSLADNMLAVFTYPRALATVKSSADEVEGQRRRHFVVCGTEGTLHIEPLDKPTARLVLSQPRGKYRAGTQEIQLPKVPRYIHEAAEFARSIRGESEPMFSYDHDFAVQKALLEACGLPIT